MVWTLRPSSRRAKMEHPTEETIIAKIEEYLRVQKEFVPVFPIIPRVPPRFGSWHDATAFADWQASLKAEEERVRQLKNTKESKLSRLRREIISLLPFEDVVIRVGDYFVSGKGGGGWRYSTLYIEEAANELQKHDTQAVHEDNQETGCLPRGC